MTEVTKSFEIRKGIINESALIGVRPPLTDVELGVVSTSLSRVAYTRITFGNIAHTPKKEDAFYTEIHMNGDCRPSTYIDDATQAVVNVLAGRGAEVMVAPETTRFVGRAGLLFKK